MNPDTFNKLSKRLLDKAAHVRKAKKEEYMATTDRLSNFRKAAELDSCTVPMAVKGMMVKHTVSIFDMVNDEFRYPDPITQPCSLDLYEEKICDHINYLLLLYGAVWEARQ